MHTLRRVVWLLWLVGGGVIVGSWLFSIQEVPTTPLITAGRLFGLLAAYSALVQLIIMARARWIEGTFGLDRVARFHRLNGYGVLGFLLLHATSMILGTASLTQQSIVATLELFITTPVVFMAQTALLLFILIVGISVYIVRQHLKFESWYYIHLLAYAAVALAAFHQFALGTTINTYSAFWWFWVLLYTITILLVAWRFLRPIYLLLRFDFRVSAVVPEAKRTTSVYITGKNLEQFHAKAGQFIMVRFLTRGRWWQEHPFSLSMLPDGMHLRITVRHVGDFTNDIGTLPVGARVMISGPHGAYTHEQARGNKLLYIAGGSGITPIRSLIEAQTHERNPKDAVLLYANHTHEETALKQELDDLAERLDMPVYYVYDDEDVPGHETGYIDAEKLARLVPDASERDVYLCGPPAMMQAVRGALHERGVAKQQIHTESFSLHVK